MRLRLKSGPLSVHVISGTYVVMFGFDLPKASCKGLAGFSVHRQDHTENEAYFLEGQKCFEATDPGFPAGKTYSTKAQPIQSFQWADYSAKPDHQYTYTFKALKGGPEALQDFATVAVKISTEKVANGGQDVFFNRGVAASQAYVARFGQKSPKDVANNAAFDWLSRGLYEAMKDFIMRDAGPGTSLRVAAYEFHYADLLNVFKAAKTKGSDIKIMYDGRKANPQEDNAAAVLAAGIKSLTKERKSNPSYLSHNKFMVRLKNGIPVAVWTGGTNFSDGGIFGHSNVAHVVYDAKIAKKYLAYWTLLFADPASEDLKLDVEVLSPLPANGKVPKGITPVFSPRSSLDALNWYAGIGGAARQGLFMTFAFGINETFQNVYKTSTAPLRFALLEKKTRPMAEGPARDAEEQKIKDLRKLNENVFAIGGLIPDNALEGWVKETLSGLNSRVNYVHNKFMLVDPLSEDPIVIAGSANFSDASTTQNDENMIVVRGNKRVADIYLGEFMRLYNHHAFRESLQWRKPTDKPKFLRTDDWWKDYFDGSSRDARRVFFR
jgi:phosphatidylserine/phosphatidylglycerophosphate/cardiolipin synthase-like enzyme